MSYIDDIYRGVGGQGPTPIPTAKFIQAWQRKEGGATNNAASFNWLNRTDKGFPKINSVGVAAYPNYQTGVQRTSQLIQSDYPSLAQAIVTGKVSLNDPGQQADLNRWVSGKRTPGASPYVQSIAGILGQNAGAAPSGGEQQAPALPLQQRQQSGLPGVMAIINHFQQQRRGGPQSVLPLIGQLMQLHSQRSQPGVPTPLPTQTPGAINPGMGGWKGTHVTDNLGWGTKTAEDIMAAPGTTVDAPEAGKVLRWGSAQGGQSMYFQGQSGREYWLGHIDKMVSPGTQVGAGQPLAVVSSDHPRPHLHIDVKG